MTPHPAVAVGGAKVSEALAIKPLEDKKAVVPETRENFLCGNKREQPHNKR